MRTNHAKKVADALPKRQNKISRLIGAGSIAMTCLLPYVAVAQDDLRITTNNSSTVQVLLNVTTNSGTPIGGLQAGDFLLSEDNASQGISSFASLKDLPVTTVFVMDYSNSNESSVINMENAVKGFIDLMDTEDEAAIITFNGNVVLNQDLTSDRDLLKAAAEAGTVGAYSKLYDAIDKAIDVIEKSNNTLGTHTIIVLSDGDDVGSAIKFAELSNHLKNVDVSVFPIGYGNEIKTQTMLNLASGTGGLYYSAAADSGQFSTIFTEISDRLNNEYRLTYTTTVTACGSHNVSVNVNTGEGQKNYSGSFDKCTTIDPPEKTASGKKGGGSLDLVTLLAGVVSLGVVRRTRRKDSTQA